HVVYPPRGVHRLRRVRARLPRRGDLREHRRDAGAPERPHRGERDLPQRRSRHDRTSGRDRQGARGVASRAHGRATRRASGGARAFLKLATWNVNGIRARHAQVQDWIERDRPDVVCLQEIKATPEQIPESLFGFANYWCYWHGGKGYSGVALHVSKTFSPERPAFSHPEFDYENRIVCVDTGELTIASVYVPNGGK